MVRQKFAAPSLINKSSTLVTKLMMIIERAMNPDPFPKDLII